MVRLITTFNVIVIASIIILFPQITFAASTCNLPCEIISTEWIVQVKKISPQASNLSSLWFRFENRGIQKSDVKIRAFLSSPLLSTQIPLFNTLNIKKIPSNSDFIFQHYDKQTKLEQLEIELTWKENDTFITDRFMVLMSENNSP